MFFTRVDLCDFLLSNDPNPSKLGVTVMKFAPLLIAFTLVAPLGAETVYTIPQGYTKITIAAADALGSTKLTSISASLLQDVSFAGSASLGTFNLANTSQTLDFGTVSWSADQWTLSGPSQSPYVVYVSVADDANNADGITPAEEAFPILSNTANGIVTIETSFDLASRFPANASIKIRKANTLDSFFGTASTSFGGNDLVYLWNGSGWDSFQYAGGQWTTVADPFTNVGPLTLVHPDEGIFVSRAEVTPIEVILFGEVPSAPQIATVTGVSFLASRFPVSTTLIDLGVATTNWTGNDILYIWNPGASPSPKWDSYQFNGGQWTTVADPFNSVNNLVIPANSAVFVSRTSAVTGENGATTSTLPYTIE